LLYLSDLFPAKNQPLKQAQSSILGLHACKHKNTSNKACPSGFGAEKAEIERKIFLLFNGSQA